MSQTADLMVVANRLPVQREGDRWVTSPGGLVSALRPVLAERGGAWVGWSGAPDGSAEPFDHEGVHLIPVPLTAETISDHYTGFANSTIWPLYHHGIREPVFDEGSWDAHVDVNRVFADAVSASANPGALIWVHDYQLQLVPQMVRERQPGVRLGFFLHIPFPPPELFLRLPWRREIVEGLLGADVVGFQTATDAQNFARTAAAIGHEVDAAGRVTVGDRLAHVRAFPISIDVLTCEELSTHPKTLARATQLRVALGNPDTVFLGVDRLDYTKGIDVRLQAFEKLLANDGPCGDGGCVFVQVAVPSREAVDQYQDLRSRVEELVGRLNGDHGEIGKPVVHYHHHSLPFEELVALYRAADVMVVTPLADGMNLVAKEFVAARSDGAGVLVLSEFAGAAHEMGGSVMVNPFDVDSVADGMIQAATMHKEDRRSRSKTNRAALDVSDVHEWARSFLAALSDEA